MEKRLQEMLDHYEITKLLNEYCHGCDRVDQTHMASVYAQNSWDDHGPDKCPGPEFAARTMAAMSGVNMCSHQLGQALIRVDGDQAGAESYFIATIRRPAPDGGETLNQLGGRYVDTLVREDGQWKIKGVSACAIGQSVTLLSMTGWPKQASCRARHRMWIPLTRSSASNIPVYRSAIRKCNGHH